MKKFLSLALALTMAQTVAACGGKTDTPPADTNDGSTAGQTGGKLVVYSALNEDNTIAIADQFKKDTGIEIEYISLGGGDAVARVQAEMANPKADILVGGSVDLYGSLATAGAFEAYDSPNNDSLDARFNDPNHFWQGWYMGVLSIIINEERFEKELAPKGVKMPKPGMICWIPTIRTCSCGPTPPRPAALTSPLPARSSAWARTLRGII